MADPMNPFENDEAELFGSEIGEMEALDEETYASLAPRGKFSAKALRMLVKATNALLPRFGQEASYELPADFLKLANGRDLVALPTDFARILVMFQAAANDAMTEEVLSDPGSVPNLDVADDRGLLSLTTAITMLAKSKDFHKFLKEPKPEGQEAEAEVVAQDDGPDFEQLMMERI